MSDMYRRMSITQDPATRSGEDETMTHDECFELLSNHRRRFTLHRLQQAEDGIELGELAEQVAAWENEIPREEISYDQRKRVYTSLQQVHLPRMDEMGVVDFDDREGTVAIGPAAEEVEVYMEVVSGREVPWSLFYTALALVNIAVVGFVALELPVVSVLSGVEIAVFVATTFLATSLAHLYISRTEMRLGANDEPPGASG
ncbi:hypothetical protein GRX03_03880 [Halovenus sp. WSH3]|uniref:DUF7344 domain-containing protein n=1 Tax=Halovenus carboxidivorans TaxID=2692199 RepID=A0A6B0SZ75_9EURY|nr:hypothetical protein [Halovenus carboxidivorans]MXR50745.1 hypothetical protein [Halovenus carboxidivorans]